MLKATIDTNIFISALLTPGRSAAIAVHLKQGAFELFYPQHLIDELLEVPFKRSLKGRITQRQIDVAIAAIKELGTFVPLSDIPAVCRDPDDDAYLACAAASDCDYLVSADPDLLDMREHGSTKIVSPAEFLKVLEQPR